jgi:hypothetical protein
LLPFEGTVDWGRLAGLIAASPYRKPVSLEANMRAYPEGTDEAAFLATAHERAAEIDARVRRARGG